MCEQPSIVPLPRPSKADPLAVAAACCMLQCMLLFCSTVCASSSSFFSSSGSSRDCVVAVARRLVFPSSPLLTARVQQVEDCLPCSHWLSRRSISGDANPLIFVLPSCMIRITDTRILCTFRLPSRAKLHMKALLGRNPDAVLLLALLCSILQPTAHAYLHLRTRRSGARTHARLLHRTNAAVEALSTGLKQEFPTFELPEFGFIGASNVGKSSLLNCISGSKIARTSKMPGRTQSVNLFRCNDGKGGACVLAG
jgi:hypothetical protein